jgi:hypothetical protein
MPESARDMLERVPITPEALEKLRKLRTLKAGDDASSLKELPPQELEYVLVKPELSV